MGWWEDISNWFGGTDSIAPTNAIGQNIDGSYILGSSPTLSNNNDGLLNTILGKIGDSKDSSSSSLWGPAITAAGGLAQTYFGQSQAKDNNELAIQQANAQRDWLAQQEANKIKAQADAAKLQAETAQKIAKMNNLANLYQTWGQINQRAGEAMGQSAIDTGKTASGVIAARASAIR